MLILDGKRTLPGFGSLFENEKHAGGGQRSGAGSREPGGQYADRNV